jgi:hypothetical protein
VVEQALLEPRAFALGGEMAFFTEVGELFLSFASLVVSFFQRYR